MIYSNRKEIELKNANQTNVNKINNINIKETICMKNKEFIKNNVEHKQNSFLIKRENNINNYVLVEIINKKQKMNKNIAEMNSKKMNDIPNKNQSKLSHRNNNETVYFTDALGAGMIIAFQIYNYYYPPGIQVNQEDNNEQEKESNIIKSENSENNNNKV